MYHHQGSRTALIKRWPENNGRTDGRRPDPSATSSANNSRSAHGACARSRNPPPHAAARSDHHSPGMHGILAWACAVSRTPTHGSASATAGGTDSALPPPEQSCAPPLRHGGCTCTTQPHSHGIKAGTAARRCASAICMRGTRKSESVRGVCVHRARDPFPVDRA